MQSYEILSRRRRLAAEFPDHKLDALLVTNLVNVRYLTGFTGSNALLVLSGSGSVLFTDPRYTIQAAEQTDCDVRTVRSELLPVISAFLARKRFRSIGFEHKDISFHAYDFLKQKLRLGVDLKPTEDLVKAHRMVKSQAEIDLIRRSVQTSSRAFSLALRRLRPGMLESEFAAEIDYQMRRLGAEKTAFETIVASGPRSALPHARPTSTPIPPDQLLLIDMGATQDGYTSDMTRTVFLGNPSARWKTAYEAVLEAQLAAIGVIRDGVRSTLPDREARKVLQHYNLDKTFTHSTGHGLGLEVHEAPRLGRRDKSVLKAGMVVTVEPGIYLHGKGGIRIEDTVLVTAGGCEILTQTSKDLTVI
ncbi:MAG: aminopeptidase P family protein [Acidobacteria bacterium]|nr:aminopeptidase P family protein [Acidobacteriota bacterium]